jgi:hypothetical protein
MPPTTRSSAALLPRNASPSSAAASRSAAAAPCNGHGPCPVYQGAAAADREAAAELGERCGAGGRRWTASLGAWRGRYVPD